MRILPYKYSVSPRPLFFSFFSLFPPFVSVRFALVVPLEESSKSSLTRRRHTSVFSAVFSSENRVPRSSVDTSESEKEKKVRAGRSGEVDQSYGTVGIDRPIDCHFVRWIPQWGETGLEFSSVHLFISFDIACRRVTNRLRFIVGILFNFFGEKVLKLITVATGQGA